MKETKTKMFFMAIFTFACLFVIASCKDNPSTVVQEEQQLFDVKWKLINFVNSSSDKAPEPTSEACFWVILKNDNTITVRTSTNDLHGKFTLDTETKTFQIKDLAGTEIKELHDGSLFVNNLLSIKKFSFVGKNLRLYSNDTDYLEFAPILKEVTPYKDKPKLAGTNWKLTKLIHTATNVEKPIYVGDEICTKLVPELSFTDDIRGFLKVAASEDYPKITVDLSARIWFYMPHYTWDRIGMYLMAFPNENLENVVPKFHDIGYEVEGDLLKLYYNQDGFFEFDPKTCKILKMGNCNPFPNDDDLEQLSDSNWYNCAVFSRIK